MEAPFVSGRDHVAVDAAPIDAGALVAHVADPGAGAVVLFLGTVRDHSSGRSGVSGLEYEAYPDVVVDKIAAIVASARGRHALERVAVVHRVGPVAVGEVSVGVAVAAAHRAEAFAAARLIIDDLKATAPIWKKETWEGGSEWVEGA
jgi:molybdopterin synthase catalytic subunit